MFWRHSNHRRSLSASAVSAAVVASLLLVAPSPAGADTPVESGWQLSWSDEFDRSAGTSIDPAKWKFDIGHEGGWGNDELQYYTDRNAVHDGRGNLVITATPDGADAYQCAYGPCRYTSSRIVTIHRFSQTYGRFEARIKVPRGQGIWPAFWALGDDIPTVGWPQSGEIDIMEHIGREPGTVHGGVHAPGWDAGGSFTLPDGQRFADRYHVFAVDWHPDHVSFSVDGVTFETRYRSDAPPGGWVFDKPFFLLLNVAVGGRWPGNPDATTQFPQRMLVDYVRAYTAEPPARSVTGPVIGLNGACMDVDRSQTADGTAVQMYECNGTDAQRWTFGTDGSIRALGKCLDVTSSGVSNGTLVQLYECNGTEAQRWQARSNGELVNTNSGRCLDAIGGSSANFTRLQIWDCWGAPQQRWTLPS